MWNDTEQHHHHLPLENYPLDPQQPHHKKPKTTDSPTPSPSLPILTNSLELPPPTDSHHPNKDPSSLLQINPSQQQQQQQQQHQHQHQHQQPTPQQQQKQQQQLQLQQNSNEPSSNEPVQPNPKPSTPELQPDLPVPSSSDNHFFTRTPKPSEENDKSISLAQAVAQFTQPNNDKPTNKSSPSSSTHSQSALHPLLKQQQQQHPQPQQQQPTQQPPPPHHHHHQQQQHQPQHTQTPFATSAPKIDQSTPNLACESPSAPNTSFEGVKFKTRSGGRPKDPVWVYFHTNGNGTDERATCKYCGWHVERPKAFRMRDHIAQCAQVDPARRAEMSQLIAFKEAAAAAKQEEKAHLATGSSVNAEILSSASKKRKMETPVHTKPALSFGKSPITSHVLDATSGKPGDDMGIRLDRLTANGFVLIANGTTDADGRCNTLLPANSRPEIGIYKVTFFSNEFYQKRGIVSFYPFVEITFEIKDPAEHYHIPLLLSPYAFSTYRGS
ncbi:hypothetical protein PGT21_036381 [Puccinia graminis f. sp. tritici]|uniref:hydroxyisourate hydrolase n=1 Tax=Puccinia graminis f. sp. tritici TaxID=56615 RepID=A0A5B0NIR5_PUCGR|nr:hypothetical protein PGT21_036381 [Puccinia graminis f. sp. tritici]